MLAVATANELLELGSAARLAGDSAAALRFYQQVRSRFPESDAAAVAAYHFGRMAFGRGSWSDAERWFGTYLAERPGGALAAEALGRSLECAEQRGDVVRIKLLASRYLETYPRGPHAPLAEQLLTESAP